jgi:hypothetical protein
VGAATFAVGALLPVSAWPAPLALALLAVHPRLIAWAAAVLARLTGRPTGAGLALSWPLVLTQLATSVALWGLSAVSFWLLVRSLTPVAPSQVARLGGAHALAFVAGFLAVPVPAGWGVREAVLAHLGAAVWPPAVAATLAAVSRLWAIGCDGVVLGVAGLVAALPPRRAAAPPAPPSARSQTACSP